MVQVDARADGDPDFEVLQRLISEEPDVALSRFDALFGLSEGSVENLDRFAAHIENGLVPVVYANHLSLADKFAASLVTNHVATRVPNAIFDKFLTVVAASIEGGQQGDYVQGLGKFFNWIYDSRGFAPDVSFVTKNDIEQRDLSGFNRQSLIKILKAPDEKMGMLIFPEGTMQGGRTNQDGRVFGMQEVTDAGLLLAGPARWKKKGKGSVFLPLGIIGSQDVFPPDPGKNRIAQDVMAMVKGERQVRQLVSVVVGEPFIYTGEETPFFMMNKVAVLLPPAQRGYYRRRR